jgi:ABC-type cobalamin/Fe3+-siderophores transport system ATPase subunit
MSSAFPLIGFSNERQRLMTSLKQRRPLLILGPGGSGKTALIDTVVRELHAPDHVIVLQHSPHLHDLLTDLARALIRMGHGGFRRWAKPGPDPERWLKQQTSSHLKGVLWGALEAEPCTIILDGVTHGSFPVYRFLQRLHFTKGMALLASAREPVAMGALTRLFWDPRNTIQVQPLKAEDASRLFDLAVIHFQLGNLNVEEFRGKALEAAKGNPGQLIEMCRLAANPMYVTGTYIKFAPLRIDALMKFL